MSLVIVAIPREDDPVWKISSEKKPHMTILFLGENGQNPMRGKIAEFLEHAASTSLTRFGLDVDRRGKLGDDEADVLFFQDNWEMPRLKEFRHQLLQDHNIRKAYDSAEQFDGWNPHLTLGYPKTPAKPTSERIHWVQFDRIALWEGDYEGVEFELKREYSPMDLAMGDTAAAGRQFLIHYGVRGMRWGVRRDKSARSVQTEAVVGAGLRGRTKVKTKGGENQPASSDAVKAAGQKQKLKKSGVASLSNKELKDLQTRMQLEVNVARLQKETQSTGKRKVREFLGDKTEQTVRNEASSFIDRQIREVKAR